MTNITESTPISTALVIGICVVVFAAGGASEWIRSRVAALEVKQETDNTALTKKQEADKAEIKAKQKETDDLLDKTTKILEELKVLSRDNKWRIDQMSDARRGE